MNIFVTNWQSIDLTGILYIYVFLAGDLLAGIEQKLNLSISSGSSYFTDSTFLLLKSSRGLKLKVSIFKFLKFFLLELSKSIFLAQL